MVLSSDSQVKGTEKADGNVPSRLDRTIPDIEKWYLESMPKVLD
jgi:hypothetical protein